MRLFYTFHSTAPSLQEPLPSLRKIDAKPEANTHRTQLSGSEDMRMIRGSHTCALILFCTKTGQSHTSAKTLFPIKKLARLKTFS